MLRNGRKKSMKTRKRWKEIKRQKDRKRWWNVAKKSLRKRGGREKYQLHTKQTSLQKMPPQKNKSGVTKNPPFLGQQSSAMKGWQQTSVLLPQMEKSVSSTSLKEATIKEVQRWLKQKRFQFLGVRTFLCLTEPHRVAEKNKDPVLCQHKFLMTIFKYGYWPHKDMIKKYLSHKSCLFSRSLLLQHADAIENRAPISALETSKQTVQFIPSSKCHKETGINKITGTLNFHSSLGVLCKYLCHDSKPAAAEWFKQQFYSCQCRGAVATGILSGVSTISALQNDHGSNSNPAHLHCASMLTLGKKILLHLCSWESQRSLCGQHKWREVKQLQWGGAEFDTSVDWKMLAEREAWKLGVVLPFHHWGNEEEMHRSPEDAEDPSVSMMNMFQTHYTIIFGWSEEYAYYTLSLQTS